MSFRKELFCFFRYFKSPSGWVYQKKQPKNGVWTARSSRPQEAMWEFFVQIYGGGPAILRYNPSGVLPAPLGGFLAFCDVPFFGQTCFGVFCGGLFGPVFFWGGRNAKNISNPHFHPLSPINSNVTEGDDVPERHPIFGACACAICIMASTSL